MRFLSQNIKETLKIRLLAILKIPLMFFCRPFVKSINDNEVTIIIPFKRRNKNHVGSMYFGALCVGADLTGGYLAMHHISKGKKKIKLLFKDFHADFFKRAEGDVHLVCSDGREIKKLVDKVSKSGNRSNMTVKILAYVPSKFEDPIAKFTLTLSLK